MLVSTANHRHLAVFSLLYARRRKSDELALPFWNPIFIIQISFIFLARNLP
jgi:hypothetical protein